jgi:hypothetical protein
MATVEQARRPFTLRDYKEKNQEGRNAGKSQGGSIPAFLLSSLFAGLLSFA